MFPKGLWRTKQKEKEKKERDKVKNKKKRTTTKEKTKDKTLHTLRETYRDIYTVNLNLRRKIKSHNRPFA